MASILETTNFSIESHPQPFVSRTDGGHLRIISKDARISDRTQLPASVAIELMFLTMIVAEALQMVMNQQGIPVVKINWEELGNWAWKRNESNKLHIHIFGRAENAKFQIFPEAVQLPDRSSGFYDGFEPLSEQDILLIRNQILELIKQYKYSHGWPLETNRLFI